MMLLRVDRMFVVNIVADFNGIILLKSQNKIVHFPQK